MALLICWDQTGSILVRRTVNCILALPLGNDMTLYYSSISTQVELRELNPIGERFESLLKSVDSHYPWSSVKKELQESIYPVYRSFSTRSSERREFVDQVLKRKVQNYWATSIHQLCSAVSAATPLETVVYSEYLLDPQLVASQNHYSIS